MALKLRIAYFRYFTVIISLCKIRKYDFIAFVY